MVYASDLDGRTCGPQTLAVAVRLHMLYKPPLNGIQSSKVSLPEPNHVDYSVPVLEDEPASMEDYVPSQSNLNPAANGLPPWPMISRASIPQIAYLKLWHSAQSKKEDLCLMKNLYEQKVRLNDIRGKRHAVEITRLL